MTRKALLLHSDYGWYLQRTGLSLHPSIKTLRPHPCLPSALFPLRASDGVGNNLLYRLLAHSFLQIRLDAGLVALPPAEWNVVHKHLVYFGRASVHALRHDKVGQDGAAYAFSKSTFRILCGLTECPEPQTKMPF